MTCRAAIVLIGSILLGSCSAGQSQTRQLSKEFLLDGASLTALVPLREFAAGIDARDASNQFGGRLVLDTDSQSNHFELLTDTLQIATPDRPGIDTLPAFDFTFVQDGKLLVPAETGPVRNAHGWWEYVLSTGRVWDEPADGGWSRAAIPFALKENREDCIHNGVMTFLYRDSGQGSDVSNVAFQLSNQTCSYLQFAMAGSLAASYVATNVTDAEQLIAAARAHRESRIETRPISEISSQYREANAAAFGSAEEIDPADMSLYGFLIDDVHYVSACGDYPYCDEMPVPSYSTAKSLVGGLGLMLLEAKYPGSASTAIGSLVAECDEDWDDVTIEHALDMTTGHYNSDDLHGDEDAAIGGRFFGTDHADKIDVACSGFPRRAEPGVHLSYHTWDTYLAGTAMNNLLKQQRGPDADFFNDLLVKQIWEPLSLSRMAANSRRTYDDFEQVYTGYGLTLLRDDIAKLARFIGAQDGRLADRPLLDRRLFDAIKQRVPGDPGLVAELDTIFYNNGFRSFDVASYLNCAEPTWLVVLSGFGGINIVIMPNDTAYYYFSDGGVHRYLSAVRESHRLRPMCEARVYP